MSIQQSINQGLSLTALLYSQTDAFKIAQHEKRITKHEKAKKVAKKGTGGAEGLSPTEKETQMEIAETGIELYRRRFELDPTIANRRAYENARREKQTLQRTGTTPSEELAQRRAASRIRESTGRGPATPEEATQMAQLAQRQEQERLAASRTAGQPTPPPETAAPTPEPTTTTEEER